MEVPHSPPEAAYTKLRAFGLKDFRGIQKQAIGALCAGRDVFGMMATSGGKSLCYQIPAAITPGYALVISPLIALMNDQASSMMERGISALAMTSDMQTATKIRLISEAGADIKCIFMAPEMLGLIYIKEALKNNPPDFVAFDEAHCISTWGADFRPDYMAVGNALDDIGQGRHIPRIGLTATASSEAVEECLHYGGFSDPVVIRQSLERSNISIFVKPVESLKATDQAILNDVRYFSGVSGIVYCQRRREVDRIHGLLKAAGYPCHRHHSGMKSDERRDNAMAFMRDQSCMVATIGFGMGIDKSDVRYVIHQEIAPTPEGWFQEMGRGGRDGKPAVSITYLQPGFTQAISLANAKRHMGWDVSKRYAQAVLGDGCRMQGVMALFGEDCAPCGHCDACLGLSRRHAHSLSSETLADMQRCDVTPEKFATSMGARAEWCALEDALFSAGLIDYDPVLRPNGPPSSRMAMTEDAYDLLPGSSIECGIPDMTPERLFASDIRGVMDLIESRCHYEGYKIPENLRKRIETTRPDACEIKKLCAIPDRVSLMLGSGINNSDREAYPTNKTEDRLIKRKGIPSIGKISL